MLETLIAGAGSMFVPEVTWRASPEQRAQYRSAEAAGNAPAFPPELDQRLDSLAKAGKVGRFQSQPMKETAAQLIKSSLGRSGRKQDGLSIAKRAARKHRVRSRTFDRFSSAQVVETPEQVRVRSLKCMEAAVRLAENAGADERRRLEAWRSGDVPGLASSYAEAARRACSGGGGVGRRRKDLQDGIEAEMRSALTQPGVTVAVMPLWFLVEPGGLLDSLAADNTVLGPRWSGRPEAP